MLTPLKEGEDQISPWVLNVQRRFPFISIAYILVFNEQTIIMSSATHRGKNITINFKIPYFLSSLCI
jgi:hypothetical protein